MREGHGHHRFTLAQLARFSGSAALLASGLTLIVVSLIDPLGAQQARIDRSYRLAATTLLCERVETYTARLGQLHALKADAGPHGLTRNEQDVLETFTAGLERLRSAERALGVQCE